MLAKTVRLNYYKTISIRLEGEWQVLSYHKKQGCGPIIWASLAALKVTDTFCPPPAPWHFELLWTHFILFLHSSPNHSADSKSFTAGIFL